jgi:hypothetical protein
MGFQISGLKREQFKEYFQLDDNALAERGARRYVADNKAGFPCRVSLIDAKPGEQVILLSYHHQAARTPYSALGPIFVRETAEDTVLPANQVPELLRSRLLSVRAYNSEDLMTDADVVNGLELENLLSRFFAEPTVSYLHIHFARPGCYACRVDRE